MIDEILAAEQETIEDAKRKMIGVQLGRVINIADPLMLGRVQVQLPSIDALDLAPWARVAMPMASELCGFYFIPQIGDQVLVAFEHGDANCPYVIGSVWSAFYLPPQPTPIPQIRGIRTITGNQLVFEEIPPSVTLQTGPTSPIPMPMPPSPVGPYSTVKLSPEGIFIMTPVMITIQVGVNTVLVSEAGVTINAGASVIEMTDASISLSSPAITIDATGVLELSGGMVLIN